MLLHSKKTLAKYFLFHCAWCRGFHWVRGHILWKLLFVVVLWFLWKKWNNRSLENFRVMFGKYCVWKENGKLVFVKLKGNVWLEVIGDYNLIISRLHTKPLHFFIFLNSIKLNLDGSLWRNPILLGICGFIRNNFPVNITSAYFGSVGVW